MSKTLVKMHILTADDSLSKIRTKHVAFKCKPQKYLNNFAESDELTESQLRLLMNILCMCGLVLDAKHVAKRLLQLD